MTRRHTTRFVTAASILLLAASAVWTQGDLSGESPLAGDSPLVELLLSQDWTRAEMAQRLLRALEVAAFQPEDCVPGDEMFSDVPASSPFCSCVEEMVRRGLTAGCAEDRYCPSDPVNRQQMAVFLVRAIEAAIEEVPEGPPGPQGREGPEGPPGPPGFAGDCNEGLAPDDEMIRVGGVCIDKYEASLWDAPVAGTQLVAVNDSHHPHVVERNELAYRSRQALEDLLQLQRLRGRLGDLRQYAAYDLLIHDGPRRGGGRRAPT